MVLGQSIIRWYSDTYLLHSHTWMNLIYRRGKYVWLQSDSVKNRISLIDHSSTIQVTQISRGPGLFGGLLRRYVPPQCGKPLLWRCRLHRMVSSLQSAMGLGCSLWCWRLEASNLITWFDFTQTCLFFNWNFRFMGAQILQAIGESMEPVLFAMVRDCFSDSSQRFTMIAALQMMAFVGASWLGKGFWELGNGSSSKQLQTQTLQGVTATVDQFYHGIPALDLLRY